ncbi:MAG: hypothetical protein ACM3ZQ_08735 [Bacillota bacterium]
MAFACRPFNYTLLSSVYQDQNVAVDYLFGSLSRTAVGNLAVVSPDTIWLRPATGSDSVTISTFFGTEASTDCVLNAAIKISTIVSIELLPTPGRSDDIAQRLLCVCEPRHYKQRQQPTSRTFPQ